MTTRTKASWLLVGAAVLIATPYLIVFGMGSVWMWRQGLIWCWAVGTGVPTLVGLAMAEWGRKLVFPRDRPVAASVRGFDPRRPGGQASRRRRFPSGGRPRIRRWTGRTCWKRSRTMC